MRYFWIPLVVAACSAESLTDAAATRPANPSLSSSSAVEHSFTGNGIQDIAPGFSYGFGGAIHSDGKGRVWGTINTHIYDLSAYGIAGSADFVGTATCLRVVGNTAYAGFVITNSTAWYSPPGSRGVLWIRDGGPGAPDVGHAGPAEFLDPNNLICSDTPPALPADPVTSGNFVVQ